MEIKYGLNSMVEEAHRVNYDFDYKAVDSMEIGFQVGHSLHLNKAGSEIIVRAFTRMVYGESGVELASDCVRAAFLVEPFDSVVSEVADDGIKISNPQLVDTFINVTIGALRGVLVANLKNTPLEGKVLPLIPMGVIHDNAIKKGKK